MQAYKFVLLIAVGIGIVGSAWAEPLTVEQAYRAVPHQQTRFDPVSSAIMDAQETEFLALFFELTDLALVARVSSQMAQAESEAVAGRYADILPRLQSLSVPARLALAHFLVVKAVTEQQAYLEQRPFGTNGFDANDPLVASSHLKLQQAYAELIRLYPQENTHNKQAFFDHLCSLDFE
jgi:hypothetical protein